MTDFILFQRAFPEYHLTQALFDRLTGKGEGRLITREGGAAIVCEDRITFLAVEPDRQGQGIGSRLLAACEEQIRSNGHEETRVEGLFPGIPAGALAFFVHRGYKADEEFVEMHMDIRGYRRHVCPIPEGVTFRIYDGSRDALLKAVAEVDEEWPQYFSPEDEVLCAYLEGELCSFCLLETVDCLISDGTKKVGSIGCVGTRPSMRGRGIALAMVEYGTELLAGRGYDSCNIHYTTLEKWYGKLGYRTWLRFWPGSKRLG